MGYTAPSTAVEEALAQIWCEVLRLEQVGIHDNFFELGGDSILSIQIIARANAGGLASHATSGVPASDHRGSGLGGGNAGCASERAGAGDGSGGAHSDPALVLRAGACSRRTTSTRRVCLTLRERGLLGDCRTGGVGSGVSPRCLAASLRSHRRGLAAEQRRRGERGFFSVVDLRSGPGRSSSAAITAACIAASGEPESVGGSAASRVLLRSRR